MDLRPNVSTKASSEELPKELRDAMELHLATTGARNLEEHDPESAIAGAYGSGACFVLTLLAEERGDILEELLRWWTGRLEGTEHPLSRKVLRSLRRLKR